MVSPPDPRSVLPAVGRLLQSETDVEVLLGRLVDLIAETMDADRATLFLIDRQRRQLYSRAAHLPELDELRLDIGQGIAGHVAATGESITVPGARRDRRFFEAIDETTGYSTESLLAVPVRAPGSATVVGVLETLNKRSAASFGNADRELLEQLAKEVAEALALTHLDDSRDRPVRFNRLVGASSAMQRVYQVIASAAATDATVLLLGESGTGKERVARAVHTNSPRAPGPFVKVDCTSIPEGLMESELFGHERGAFTGADRRVLGKCELAAGGTLFFDEIGELPLALQGKLLRFLQEREIERVGGREVIRADVRVVAATNRNLEALVEGGEFRRDLFYRIKVVQLELPPLRARGGDDVEQLSRHFLRSYARRHHRPARRFDERALARLRDHPWPGNIRELEHCIESAVVFCDGEVIEPAHLSIPSASPPSATSGAVDALPRGLTLAEVERLYIEKTLDHCGGNRTRAAALLGIGRNTLLRKLKQYELA